MPKEILKITPAEALLKAAHYCAYQERCHNEVRHKLAEWGIYGTTADELILKLIEQNYLNEERFAKAFAGGKFRVKQWGRLKIKRELKIRGLSDYCINLALKEIEDDHYILTLKNLMVSKLNSVKSAHPLEKKQKVYHYLATRGYEGDIILDLFKEIQNLSN
jgi:regulatory protein